MDKRDNKKLLIYILLGWLVINFLQAALTGLFDDEALFWMYGQKPNWGYYEHPPMVGMLIRAGYEIFHNEIGVRLIFVILSALTFYLIARVARVEDPMLLAALGFSTIIAQAGGFMAAPDVPLLFFTILFFLVYKKLLDNDSVWLAVAWGVIMASMIYSKYNGILVILFTIISNLKLFKNRYFYIAAASGIICMIPHILWSFRNGHPTAYYHLFERNFEQFDFIRYFIDYIIGQIGIYGPLMGFILFWTMIVFRPEDTFEKSLKFTTIGMMLFFMAYSFHGKIEPNWTVPAFAPMLIIGYRVCRQRLRLRKWIMALAAVSLIFTIGLRVYLVHDYLQLPRSLVNLSELYGWREWSGEVGKRAGNRPVLFINSYQRCSKYIFYTGKPAYTLDDYAGHRTQYYYWGDMEKCLQGKDIMAVDFQPWRYLPNKQSFETSNHITTYYAYWGPFYSHYQLILKFRLKNLRFPANAVITLPITIVNPYKDTVRFNQNQWMPAWLVYHIHYKDTFIAQAVPSTDITKMVISGASKDTTIRFRTPSQPGNYYFWVSVASGWVPPARNMNYQMMEIY